MNALPKIPYDFMNSNGSNSRDCFYNMIKFLAKQRADLNIVHINTQSLNNKTDKFIYLCQLVFTLFEFLEPSYQFKI